MIREFEETAHCEPSGPWGFEGSASGKAPASPKVLPPMEHQPAANSSANEERESVKKETSSEDILVRPKSIKS